MVPEGLRVGRVGHVGAGIVVHSAEVWHVLDVFEELGGDGEGDEEVHCNSPSLKKKPIHAREEGECV